MVFRIFSLSSVDDEQFLAFFVLRRPTTSDFLRFLHFVGRQWIVFGVFRASSADDE